MAAPSPKRQKQTVAPEPITKIVIESGIVIKTNIRAPNVHYFNSFASVSIQNTIVIHLSVSNAHLPDESVVTFKFKEGNKFSKRAGEWIKVITFVKDDRSELTSSIDFGVNNYSYVSDIGRHFINREESIGNLSITVMFTTIRGYIAVIPNKRIKASGKYIGFTCIMLIVV
jgi:hypothetical protein